MRGNPKGPGGKLSGFLSLWNQQQMTSDKTEATRIEKSIFHCYLSLNALPADFYIWKTARKIEIPYQNTISLKSSWQNADQVAFNP